MRLKSICIIFVVLSNLIALPFFVKADVTTDELADADEIVWIDQNYDGGTWESGSYTNTWADDTSYWCTGYDDAYPAETTNRWYSVLTFDFSALGIIKLNSLTFDWRGYAGGWNSACNPGTDDNPDCVDVGVCQLSYIWVYDWSTSTWDQLSTSSYKLNANWDTVQQQIVRTNNTPEESWISGAGLIKIGFEHYETGMNDNYETKVATNYASLDISYEIQEVPEITSFSFSTVLDQININWVTEYEIGGIVDVECTLNGIQNCNPFPYSAEPGGGGCTIMLPQYDMTPDPGGSPRTVQNTLYCRVYDHSTPAIFSEYTRIFYPLSFDAIMPASMSLVVGEEQNLVITVKNNGTLSDTYSVSVSATSPEILIIENGDQTTELLDTNDVQQVYVGVNILTSEQTANADVRVSSDISQSYTEISSDQTVTVRGGVKSLPDFSFFGVLQIMLIATAALVSFLF